MTITGHVICHNEYPDILRCLDSLYVFCDKIMVVYGGKPGTPMRKFLEQRKRIYNMEIYDREFDTVREQRNFLLSKTEKNQWIACLDPDEKYARTLEWYLREFIETKVDQTIYDDPKRTAPLVIPINHHNLLDDILHFDGTPIWHYQKVFYYDRNLHWYRPFYTHITYSDKKGERGLVWLLPAIKGFAIMHYARLCPERLEWRKKSIGDVKTGAYEENAWFKDIAAKVKVRQECL